MRLLLLFAALGGIAQAQEAGRERWSFTIEPYVWLPSLDGQGSAEGSPSVEVDVVGELDTAFPLALRADAPGGRFALTLDALYAGWRDDEGSLRTDTEVRLLEGGIGLPVGRGWEVTAGLRGVRLDFEVELGSVDEREEASFVDPWIGARSDLALGDAWALRLAGDVGGFGVGSDLSWQALAFLAWLPSSRWRVELGYRALAVDFEDDDLEYDLLAHGPILALAWRL